MTKLKILLIALIFNLISCKNSVGLNQNEVCNKDEIYSMKLISAEDALKILKSNPDYIPIEVSKDSEYKKGHIDGAVNVWRPDFRAKSFTDYNGMICRSEELIDFLKNIGTKSNSTLLIYDNKGGCDAMRLSWVFDFYGFDHYKILNGGKASWKKHNYPLVTSENQIKRTSEFTFKTQPDSSLYATRTDVLKAINDTNTLLIDTREPYEYLGHPFIANNEVLDYKKGAFARGSIPSAIHLNWSELSDLEDDHRIKCTSDLLYNLQQKGIEKDKHIIVYCQSGSRSSHTSFVLKEILKSVSYTHLTLPTTPYV